jgi:hypothetical protein
MITRLLNKHAGPLYRALLICTGFLCFLIPTAGIDILAGLHLRGSELALGLGVVVSLTIEGMILFVVVALADKIFVKRPTQEGL